MAEIGHPQVDRGVRQAFAADSSVAVVARSPSRDTKRHQRRRVRIDDDARI